MIRLFGLTMAQAQHDLGDLFSQQDDGFIQLYPDGLEIEVHLATHHKEKKKANQQLESLKDEVTDRLADYIIGHGKTDLPNRVRE